MSRTHLPFTRQPALCALAALLVLCALSCEKKPSGEAWTGTVAGVETINGMTVTLKNGETTLPGMREGSKVPPNTEAMTQPGTRIVMETSEGSSIVVDGKSHFRFDQMRARAGALVRGRARVTFGSAGGALKLAGHWLEATPKTVVFVEADGKRGSFAVAAGSAKIDDQPLPEGYAAEVLPESKPTTFFAWDMEQRTGWVEPTETSIGYGKVDRKNFILRRHHVRATLTGNLAYTEVVEGFENLGSDPEQLVFKYELPEGAIPIEVAIRQGQAWVESYVDEQDHARATFDRAERDGREAVFMQVDEREVELRVANVPGDAVQEVRVRYVEELEPTFGAARYRYSMPWDRKGDLSAKQFSIEVSAPGLSPDELEAYGYDLEIEPATQGVVARFSAEDFVPVGDFVAVSRPRGNARLLREERDGEHFVALTIQPEIPEVERTRKADFMIVVDTSGSRSRLRDEDLAIVQELLAKLPEESRAMVAACDDRCRPVSDKKFTRPDFTARGLEQAFPTDYSRSTNILEVARFARMVFEKLGTDRERRVVYISDGSATAGPLDPGIDFEKTVTDGEMTIDIIGPYAPSKLGKHALLAGAGRGTYTQRVTDDANATVTALLEHSRYHVLSRIGVELPAAYKAIHPRGLIPLRRGESLTLLAKATDAAPPKTVRIVGSLGGETFEQKFEVQASVVEKPVASSAWANAEITRLEMLGSDDEALSAIAARYQVPSSATAFVAVAPEPAVAQTPPTIHLDGPRPRPSGVIQQKRKIRQKRKRKRKPSPSIEIISGRDGWSVPHGRSPRRPVTPPALESEKVDLFVLDPGDAGRTSARFASDMRYVKVETCVREHADSIWRRGELRVKVQHVDSEKGSEIEILENRLGSDAFAQCIVDQLKDRKLTNYRTEGESFEIGIRMRVRTDSVVSGAEVRASAASVTLNDGVYPPALFERAFLAREHRSAQAKLSRRMLDGEVRQETAKTFEERGFLDQVPNWLEEVAAAVEDDPSRARWVQAAAVEKNAARSCAYMQSVDSVDGLAPRTCPRTSDLVWLGVTPPPTEAPAEIENPKLSILYASEEPDRRLLLVRVDGARFWWLEGGEDARCELDSRRRLDKLRVREECVFDDLGTGVYALMLAPTQYGEPRAPATFVVTLDGRENTVEWSGDTLIAATIIVGSLNLPAPELQMKTFESRSVAGSFVESLRPAVNYCVLPRFEASDNEETSPLPVRVTFAFSNNSDRDSSLKSVTGLLPSELDCLAPYIKTPQFESEETITMTL